jgi:hypothetical protein
MRLGSETEPGPQLVTWGKSPFNVELIDRAVFERELEVISIRDAENAGTLGKRPFSDLHGHVQGNASRPDRWK